MSDHILLLPPSPAPPPPRLRLLQPALALPSYQLYAVERWITARDRHPLLLVHTGHPDHSVVLHAYAPQDIQAWEDALAALRTTGARPKHTPYGTLMLTSLAHFRSDYTIVPIPGGDYLAVQDQLYANINLLRMGCSGRSALTLEDPSDTTKDRFISAFLLPESTLAPFPGSSEHLPMPPLIHTSSYTSPNRHSRKPRNLSTSSLPVLLVGKTKDRPAFVATVLELVRLIQAGLAIFGMYPIECASVSPTLLLDGLLCDTTLHGIQLWTSRIGALCLGLQPTDRIVDPSFVAALLSLVLATRNRLAFLGYSFILPRDPFLYPHAFALALTTYLQSTAPPPITTGLLSHHSNAVFTSPQGSVHLSSPLIPPAPPPTTVLSAAAASAAASANPIGAVLTRDTVDAIAAQHDHRARTESRRVRRVLKGKRAAATPGVDSDGADGAPPERDHTRMHTLNLSLSLSGGEEPPAPGAPGKSQQLLSGLASGLRGGSAALANVGVNVGGGAAGDGATGDPGAVVVPTKDLAAFVLLVAGTGRPGARGGGRSKRQSREVEYGAPGAPAEDAVVGASVRALWGGRVSELVRMREEVHDTGAKERRAPPPPTRLGSDGEESNARSCDGRSTEEESDLAAPGPTGAFGGMWGGRVRGKLGTWAGGLSRKKHYSVDLGSPSPQGAPRRKDAEALPLAQALSHGSSQQSQSQSESQRPPEPHRGRPQPGRLVIGGNGSPGNLSRRTSAAASRAQSPTLPPMVFSFDMDREMDDDDLLSSGQVSPLSDDRPGPFNVPGDAAASLAGSSTRLAALAALELERSQRTRARAVQSARVASWAGPRGEHRWRVLDEDEDDHGLGARAPRSLASDEDAESEASHVGPGPRERKRREKARFHSLLSVVDGAGVHAQEMLESEDDEEEEEGEETQGGYISDDEGAAVRRQRRAGFDPRRRRSFHDLDTFRGTDVLAPERMALDVELCGELLTMWRREEHLRNVITCVRLLSASLAHTSTGLRAHHDAHADAIRGIERRASVLAALDAAHTTADTLAQATHTLRYESEQFHVDDLWAAARPPRRTVLELRARVFGAGGRRLRPGAHGAHGPFNRLQRTLDGRERLVDHLGRTEEEAEEERDLEALGAYLDSPASAQEATEGGVPGEDEGDVVEHPGIKPMWLLRFFTSWGARWSAAVSAAPAPVADGKDAKPPAVPQSAPVVSTMAPLVETEKMARPASH